MRTDSAGASRYYFAYGSNMKRSQMVERCPNHCELGLGRLVDYKWIISARGFANVIASPGDYVEGVVFEISASDEETLDRKEGVRSGSYQKAYQMVHMPSQSIECLVYIDPVTDLGRPRDEYVLRINQGLLDSKLSTDYINKYIRPFLPANLGAPHA